MTFSTKYKPIPWIGNISQIKKKKKDYPDIVLFIC